MGMTIPYISAVESSSARLVIRRWKKRGTLEIESRQRKLDGSVGIDLKG